MKDINEIKKETGLRIKKENKNGFGGIYYSKIIYNNGKPKLENPLNFLFSWACGFEHLSVSTPTRCPTWEEMCIMKDLFWKDDEVCMQLHPAKEDYIDNMKYCLHIWKPINQEIPKPPSIMVGLRPNKLSEDFVELLKFAKEMNVEIPEEVFKEAKSLGINFDIEAVNKLKNMEGIF